MTFDIVIPTLNRTEKLINCLNSILKSKTKSKINIHIYFSSIADRDELQKNMPVIDEIRYKMINTYKVPSFWNSHLKDMVSDAMIYLNDDVLLYEDTLDIIEREFSRVFPDTDGIMGLNQVNIVDVNKVDAAFGVIGKKYADRFNDRQVWCLDYERFYADFEIWKYAKSINKFYFCSEASIEHLHPCVNINFKDSTHNEVRKWIKKDKITFAKRQAQGLLWGKNFELINKE